MTASKCPKCGDKPSFVHHLEKWYCYECNSYVDGAGDHAAKSAVNDGLAKAEAAVPAAEVVAPKHDDFKDYSDDNEAEIAAESAVEEAEPAPEAEPEKAKVKPEPVVVEAPPVPAKPAAKAEQEIRMCLTCGQPLKLIEKYQRHYCYGCKKYAPKEDKPKEEPKAAPAAEMKTCPDCQGALKYVEKYGDWYCYKCKKYPLRRKKPAEQKPQKPVEHKPAEQKPAEKKPAVSAPAPPTAKAGKGCPKCGKPLKYIEKYERDYCHECKAYAPKETKTCPVCHEAMKFVPQYNEWYCYKCKKYSLRPSKPMLLL